MLTGVKNRCRLSNTSELTREEILWSCYTWVVGLLPAVGIRIWKSQLIFSWWLCKASGRLLVSHQFGEKSTNKFILISWKWSIKTLIKNFSLFIRTRQSGNAPASFSVKYHPWHYFSAADSYTRFLFLLSLKSLLNPMYLANRRFVENRSYFFQLFLHEGIHQGLWNDNLNFGSHYNEFSELLLRLIRTCHFWMLV